MRNDLAPGAFFLLSLLLFSAAALGAGMADSLSALIFWRALQGMGGGLLIPVGQAMTWQYFQSHERQSSPPR
ncbi:drug resistance MFS transporter, drug:H+ antiporter-2 (14 Spanner) (DHA2) family [Raoultella terrigena]|uniref:Drug resistance MFS transporter, drug:H+ antiporter-2 (14 Spanner) (DHA2) family n=1 Tax=Raoultella terrigena TaxID=577 RepID=A0A3P8KG92_RAOTE|nr:drug resistance MFS transporter, drug:H+ antiporter-2 (14 Spanner) (DHA2) family [Raoultella terrigena]